MTVDDHTAAVRSVAEALLSDGERLLWAGRPNPLRLVKGNLMQPLFGLFWTGVIIFMFTKVSSFNTGFSLSRPSNSGFLMVFQLVLGVFLLVGLALILSPVWNYLNALSIVYAITNERALIIQHFPSQSIRSYSTRNIQRVERRGSEQEGDIIFGRERRTSTDHASGPQGGIHIHFDDSGAHVGPHRRTRTVSVPIGFLGVAQPREVEAQLLNALQAHPNPAPGQDRAW